MTFGVDFFCIVDGERVADRRFPKLLPFFYADGDGGWLLLEDFTIEVKVGGSWLQITAKAGFDYDGASIPRACWSIIGSKMDHDLIVAALFHDLLYCVHVRMFPRDVCDQLFADIQGMYFATAAQQTLTRKAVNWFGGGTWKKSQADIDKYLPFIAVRLSA